MELRQAQVRHKVHQQQTKQTVRITQAIRQVRQAQQIRQHKQPQPNFQKLAWICHYNQEITRKGDFYYQNA